MLSHAICDGAQPNGGEEVDAETHVAGRVLCVCRKSASEVLQEDPGVNACLPDVLGRLRVAGTASETRRHSRL